ncbi:MAG: bifunctional diaminohydroxyphosphoribosylaminopyrimidine deaminase/5-amino-6-(5-phosphoribosylamino)uracil reductase RibD [Cocleimonas sp.]|nr:bifunctional diaminohydroxyphosphoribosylaminopyrimidine deaminase/5-amino-6-(5-phosphoribosylamino)uracil reductase RibD [Cocleimonas sp.]
MSISPDDFRFIAKAIQLAKKGQYTTHPNPRVGCVIVKNGKIIGEGYHQKAGQPHAEINALLQLQSANKLAKGAVAYVTLEPCSHTGKTPPCADALIDAGISRVVIAMQDPNPQVAGQGIQRLRDAGITVEVGVLEEQARALNIGFIKRMEQGLPWVRIKLAMSLDGRTAMASGESQWITGSAARQDVQRLRAKADAILTGSGTVLEDDPSLNVRITSEELDLDKGMKYQQPLRVILDSSLKISSKAKILKLAGDTLIYTCSDNNDKSQALEQAEAKIISLDSVKVGGCANGTKKLPLSVVLQDLAKQQINEVHVEAGATLCGALLQEKLVDEIIIYMAPTIMGADARGLFNLPELSKMKDKIDFKIQDIRAVGDDWRLQIIPL